MDEYYKSWAKIISANAKQIFPAHGKSFSVEKLKKNLGKNKKENMVMNK
jgi:glyoxylase-like metal-dependent hydrolase (beta-lactamase superfamily II)